MPKQASVQLREKKSSRTFSEKIGANGEVDFKTGVLPGSYEISLQNARTSS